MSKSFTVEVQASVAGGTEHRLIVYLSIHNGDKHGAATCVLTAENLASLGVTSEEVADKMNAMLEPPDTTAIDELRKLLDLSLKKNVELDKSNARLQRTNAIQQQDILHLQGRLQ